MADVCKCVVLVSKERNVALEGYLRKGHYMFSKVNGQFGNTEHCYAIAGLSPAEAETLSTRFGQQSSINCKLDPELIQKAINLIDAKYKCMDQAKQAHFNKSLTEGMTGRGRYQERIMAGL